MKRLVCRNWYCSKIDASGHATVKFIDTGQCDLSILHLLPGGEWGGQGGTNPRIDRDSKTIEVDYILRVGIIKSLRGLKNLELQRFEHFTLQNDMSSKVNWMI